MAIPAFVPMREGAAEHRPVLLEEALAALAVRPDGVYVDGTFGRGGHAEAILRLLGPDGRLIAFDRDPQAVASARERFADDSRFTIVHGSFASLEERLLQEGLMGKVDGILLDLGVSSPQLDDAARGFSFSIDGPLDMRMDPGQGHPASRWINRASEEELADVFFHYGEERHSRRIARAIVRARQEEPLERTRQLAELVARVVPGRGQRRHPATRVFQAVRIFINRELDELQRVLPQCVAALAPGGRLVVISFHSLEDRMVKEFMRQQSRGVEPPRGLPVTGTPERGVLRPIGKAVRPGEEEVAENPRARSAVMRVAERR